MSSLYDRYNIVNQRAQSSLSFLNRPVFAAVLQIFFVLFASQFAAALPDKVHKFVDTPAAQVAVLGVASWTFSRNPAFSVALVLGYILMTQKLNSRYIEKFPSSNRTAIMTSCMNFTVS